MGIELEYPFTENEKEWAFLYRARESDVSSSRPIFTGDVFLDTLVFGEGAPAKKDVLILQHPCALRSDGVHLAERLVVAEVKRFKVLDRNEWAGNFAKMPLPGLRPSIDSSRRHAAGMFDRPHLVAAKNLLPSHRVASLSQGGVNLLLQRWVHHNSRAVIPTTTYQEVSSAAYEEADLIEEWVEERSLSGMSVEDAEQEAVAWLRAGDPGQTTRQQLLQDPQARSSVRREMRTALRRT